LDFNFILTIVDDDDDVNRVIDKVSKRWLHSTGVITIIKIY